jgi:hypothetical protein
MATLSRIIGGVAKVSAPHTAGYKLFRHKIRIPVRESHRFDQRMRMHALSGTIASGEQRDGSELASHSMSPPQPTTMRTAAMHANFDGEEI